MVRAPLGASEPATSTSRAPAAAAGTKKTATAAAAASRIPRIVPSMVDARDRPVKPSSPGSLHPVVALALDPDEVRVLCDALVHDAATRVHDRAEAMAVEEPLPRREARPALGAWLQRRAREERPRAVLLQLLDLDHDAVLRRLDDSPEVHPAARLDARRGVERDRRGHVQLLLRAGEGGSRLPAHLEDRVAQGAREDEQVVPVLVGDDGAPELRERARVREGVPEQRDLRAVRAGADDLARHRNRLA